MERPKTSHISRPLIQTVQGNSSFTKKPVIQISRENVSITKEATAPFSCDKSSPTRDPVKPSDILQSLNASKVAKARFDTESSKEALPTNYTVLFTDSPERESSKEPRSPEKKLLNIKNYKGQIYNENSPREKPEQANPGKSFTTLKPMKPESGIAHPQDIASYLKTEDSHQSKAEQMFWSNNAQKNQNHSVEQNRLNTANDENRRSRRSKQTIKRVACFQTTEASVEKDALNNLTMKIRGDMHNKMNQTMFANEKIPQLTHWAEGQSFFDYVSKAARVKAERQFFANRKESPEIKVEKGKDIEEMKKVWRGIFLQKLQNGSTDPLKTSITFTDKDRLRLDNEDEIRFMPYNTEPLKISSIRGSHADKLNQSIIYNTMPNERSFEYSSPERTASPLKDRRTHTVSRVQKDDENIPKDNKSVEMNKTKPGFEGQNDRRMLSFIPTLHAKQKQKMTAHKPKVWRTRKEEESFDMSPCIIKSNAHSPEKQNLNKSCIESITSLGLNSGIIHSRKRNDSKDVLKKILQVNRRMLK